MEEASGEDTNPDDVDSIGEVCSWCGKSERSGIWRMGGFSYCSFRCCAATQHRNFVLIAVLLAPVLFAIVLFPQIMFELVMIYTVGSTSSPNLTSVAIGIFLMLAFCAIGIGSLYTAYVGWSIRRMGDTEFVGHMSDAQRYPRREQYGETHHRCEWCGEPSVNAFWSGEKGKYCSFRCNAAGNYRSFLAMLFGVLGLATIFAGMMYIMMARSGPVTQIDPFLVLLLIIMAIPILSCVYVVYVGRSMNRARQTDDK